MTTCTLSPRCSKVASPRVLLPLVGSSPAVARAGSEGVLWHAARTASATMESAIFVISSSLRWDSSKRGTWTCPCPSCSWRRPCRAPCPAARRPSPCWRRPCRRRPSSLPRSSPAGPGAWRGRRRRRRSAARPGAPSGCVSCLLLHVGRAGGNGPARGCLPARLDLVVPDRMVLLGPGLVGVAGAHVAVRALDADRAHVDVAERKRDVDDRRHHVPDPRFLQDRKSVV